MRSIMFILMLCQVSLQKEKLKKAEHVVKSEFGHSLKGLKCAIVLFPRISSLMKQSMNLKIAVGV